MIAMASPLTVWLILIAVAGVPPDVTRWDVADCNVKARDSVPAVRPPIDIAAAAAVPRVPQPETAPAAGRQVAPGDRQVAPGDTTMSPGEPDTEVQGLARHRAADAAYVVAYRLCMRQRGF